MKKGVSKRAISLVLALAMAFGGVLIDHTPVKAAASYTVVYSSDSAETAYAGKEVRIPFTVSVNEGVDMILLVESPAATSLALYNSSGNLLAADNNPLSVLASEYIDMSSYGISGYVYQDSWGALSAGDYYYGITFESDTYYKLEIDAYQAPAELSQTTATITKGFTKKLSVTGGEVKSWSSSKKSVAAVNSSGKVTAKKAGKATITATLTDGTKLKCKVTVKENKYTATKATVGNSTYGDCTMQVYKMSFDSKGNLVIKATVVNRTYYKVYKLQNIKIVVKDGNGKKIGTYKGSKTVTVPSGSAKDLTFTIKKSDLKQKKADLRNAQYPTCTGKYVYYTYY